MILIDITPQNSSRIQAHTNITTTRQIPSYGRIQRSQKFNEFIASSYEKNSIVVNETELYHLVDKK